MVASGYVASASICGFFTLLMLGKPLRWSYGKEPFLTGVILCSAVTQALYAGLMQDDTVHDQADLSNPDRPRIISLLLLPMAVVQSDRCWPERWKSRKTEFVCIYLALTIAIAYAVNVSEVTRGILFCVWMALPALTWLVLNRWMPSSRLVIYDVLSIIVSLGAAAMAIAFFAWGYYLWGGAICVYVAVAAAIYRLHYVKRHSPQALNNDNSIIPAQHPPPNNDKIQMHGMSDSSMYEEEEEI
jgi:hypothetical protein